MEDSQRTRSPTTRGNPEGRPQLGCRGAVQGGVNRSLRRWGGSHGTHTRCVQSRSPMRRHINPALVISIIALIGAWGGPAVARSLIGSKEVKDRSLQGRDIASSTITSRNVTALKGSDILPDSLDGSDISERTLNIPKVDAARKADSVNGVAIEPFNYADPEGKSQVFYDKGGLRVAAFCNNGVFEVGAS